MANFLTKRYGALPGYGWLLVGYGAAWLFARITSRKQVIE